MANYIVKANIPVSVQVSSHEIVEILKQEKIRIHGGRDRYVQFGKLYEDNYDETEVLIRDLSADEHELDFAINKMIAYFHNLGDRS